MQQSTHTRAAITLVGAAAVLAPISTASIRAARRALDPGAPYEQDPDVAVDLATVRRLTASLPFWQSFGAAELDWRLQRIDRAEDRLLDAHGHTVPTAEQRFRTRQAMEAAAAAVQAAADLAHPDADCRRCRTWKDCPDADRAYRDALLTDWVNRWTTST